jgi:long-chain acyl-CoA synthetase
MEATLGQMLATASKRFGGKPVVIAIDRTLSFADLDRFSTRFAHALRGLGVGPGDRVTLRIENGWRWMVAYYAVLKLGGIVNPCNILLTADEVAFIVGDCGAKLVIASADKFSTPPKTLGARIVTDRMAEGADLHMDALLAETARDDRHSAPLEVWSDAGSASTIGYTSGTTGHPKGAVLSHSTIVLNTAMTSLMHGRAPSDIVVSALPCTHVYGNIVMNSAVTCDQHRQDSAPHAGELENLNLHQETSHG